MGVPTGAAGRDNPSDTNRDAPLKPEEPASVEPAKTLPPPPRPAQQQSGNTPDYFNSAAGSLSLEPNPFEQSFGGSAPPETPGGTKLPSVAALTSPSSLLPGSTPFSWGAGSLRTGPLSPAMLSGPTNDYFGDTHHIRGGFPTPNESSLRTGLTPGGSGSMFPAPSPNSQALFAQINGPAPTPGTLDFHRTALSAAAAKREQAHAQQPSSLPVAPTSQPQDMPGGGQAPKAEPKAAADPFDPHDNDAANGLFMLARGRNSTQPGPVSQYPPPPPAPVQPHADPSGAPAVQPLSTNTSPQMDGAPSLTGSSVRGASEASAGSDESEVARPNTRSRGKRSSGGAAANSRRKAEDAPVKAPRPRKPSRTVHDTKNGKEEASSGSKPKMTEEEKRRNFLERNRVAALKCRQRKKQWLANLQNKVEAYSNENESLTNQIVHLREEVVSLKTLLLAHKDCPITQQQNVQHAIMQQGLEPYNPQMNPYGLPPAISGQPVMAGRAMNRRFS
ncbi:47f4f75a-d296-402e-9e52-4fe4409de2ca [Thermothielavioides terrestris]|uniref:47f4f75a-d296-402e-9e52-4fe4409de2ca n=1 Tax=Thermothielavioides terrestris TaxID=2587410 RepID=A0A446BI38_9PEZI|nr:47f4f75a-d296-402e-9e52-4fe4409de2ca [Thermothielavioides terrestris]